MPFPLRCRKTTPSPIRFGHLAAWPDYALVFRCKLTGGDLTTTGETSAFRWATNSEVSALTEEAYAVRVLDALNGDRQPAVRHHDGVHLL